MQLKRAVALVLAVWLALPLAGCWDRAELEEIAFVLAVGLDKGKENTYSVTFAIALPAKMGGDKGGGGGGDKDEKPYMLTTVEAPSVTGAMAMADSYLSRRLSLMHTKALFMGEELARVSGLHAMDEFGRFREARRTVVFVVTEGKAKEFLDGMKPQLEKDPNKFITELTDHYRDTGLIPAGSQVQHFVTRVNTGYIQPITYYAALKKEDEEEEMEQDGGQSKEGQGSDEDGKHSFISGELPREGGPNIEMVGGAAFRRDQLVGILTGDEMRMVLLLQDKFESAVFSFKDPRRPELFVSAELHRGRGTQIDVQVSGERPRIRGVITLEGEILAMQSGVDYTEPELQLVLEEAIAKELSQNAAKLVQKTQSWETDVIGFGRQAVKHFATVDDWHAYDWLSKYPKAEVEIAVRTTLRRFGQRLSPPDASE